MAQANFGSGDLIIVPPSTDADTTPVRVGVLQDVELDYASSMKFLMGGSQFAVEAANADAKLSGKAKFGKIDGRLVNRILAGSTIAVGSKIKVDETGTVTAAAYTVAGSATFADNLGVYDATGLPFKQVASAPAVLQYSGPVAGVYTFNAGDNGKVLTFRYTKTQAAIGNTVTLNNQPMAIATKFVVECFNTATANAQKVLAAKLFAVVFPKIKLPFKNTDFTIPDIEFECLDNGSGQVGEIYTND